MHLLLAKTDRSDALIRLPLVVKSNISFFPLLLQ